MTIGMIQPALIVPLRYSVPRSQRVGFYFQYWAGLGRVGVLKFSIGYPIFSRVYLGISGIISLSVKWVFSVIPEIPSDVRAHSKFLVTWKLDSNEMSCIHKIRGNTRHFGLPNTQWFSKLNCVWYRKNCQEGDGPCLYLTESATTVNDIHTCQRWTLEFVDPVGEQEWV